MSRAQTIPTPMRSLTEAEDRLRKALGKAGHIAAIVRVCEIWPNAHIEVEQNPPSTFGLGSTHVTLYDRDPNGPEVGEQVLGSSWCHYDDQWQRETGLRLAFSRAATTLSKRHNGTEGER